MGLDLSALSRQVRAMSGSLATEASDKQERTQLALGRYLEESAAYADWARAAELSRETAAWLLAHPVEPLDTIRDLPPRPPDYALVATDGSQIDVERHGMAACYVINIGRVFLRYGARPAAKLSSRPALYYREEDLYLSDGVRRIAIEGNYLSAKRDIEEGVALAELADEFLSANSANLHDNNSVRATSDAIREHSREFVAQIPSIALQDGTLVRWTLAGAEKFVQERFLRPYLAYLDRMRERGIPVASYISRPRAPEVAGTIRLMLCPDVKLAEGRGAKCAECSDAAAGRTPSCSVCQGLTDADILADMLGDGQRGPLFISMSRVNVESYGAHLIHFFYMRVGREIARVELPRWVAEDLDAVDLVHTLIYDQCMKGQGYPVALARAHEQAIVRGADRRAFLSIVEGSLLRAELPASDSRKRESKERQSV
ncbi:MAG TPA: DNA double-strand break repair nuclease NurA [Roseiflexaceae bacterium]|nr:DNA double-strand break repair nuclease NurA [Roseiflexaceae bacterium]